MSLRGPENRMRLLGWLLLLLTACVARPVAQPATPSSLPEETSPSPLSPLPSPSPPAIPPSPDPSPTPAPTPTVPAPITHIVQPGDTLLGLAMAYRVPMAAIQLSNGLGDSTALYAGQRLTIPSATDWEGASPYWIVHIVRAGETLIGISQQYGLEVGAVQAANGLATADVIYAGQELVLPLDRLAVTATPRPTQPPAPPSPSPPQPVAPPVPPPPDVAAWPGEVARLINQVRAAHGLPPLGYDERLAAAAQAQASDCSQRGWCSHAGSDGSTAAQRIRRAGYEAAFTAECWVWTATPQRAVELWMDEVPPNDPHRRTLLSPTLTQVGVGIAPATWGYYFVADFGRPAASP